MFSFLLGIVFLLGAIAILLLGRAVIYAAWLRILAVGVCCGVGILLMVFSSTLWVAPAKGGLITKKFGPSLRDGHIIAANGERGAQANVISPGWSFGPPDKVGLWWPWLYELEAVDNKSIPEGSIGVVTAQDGNPLPEGEIYAKPWDNPTEMIDAQTFMSKNGCKGPQLTVLPPGQYRYNPKLFDIQVASCVDIPIGIVGVIRANAGVVDTNMFSGQDANGTPLVKKVYRGIWDEPLMPGKYYLHPNAYQVVRVGTTKRVYSYTSAKGSEANTSNAKEPDGDNSIHVRSSDSFEFPVDVRVAVAITASNAPYIVAKIGDPDSDSNKDGFDLLEEKCILPSVRAIMRNSAEAKKAIEYVNARSTVEADANEKFTTAMAKDKIEVEGFYLADIGLKRTPEGQALLKTQTDKELAMQQQAQYQEQVKAEEQRALKVKAEEAANQQKRIQESLANIEYEKNGAEAAKNKATGEAAAYDAKGKALGGTENLVKLEITKMMLDKLAEALVQWKPNLPEIMVMGGSGNSGGANGDVMTGLFAQFMQNAKTPTNAVK